jgi:NADPH-dependent glutamate synthase beta subunit-like oxidoreductase
MTEAAIKEETKALTFRRYQDGEEGHVPWNEDVIRYGESHKCPTYVQRTPPCQASCPSGHDIRGWLDIVRGMDKPVGGKPWQEYAFERMVEANPFPAIMGRVCPAPCQDGCNRNEVDEHVGINSVEQFIGDWALENNLKLPPAGPDTGKKVAIIGGGPAGLAAAYFLRRKGHACTIFEEYSGLGGMMLFGIPGYRTPRDVLDGEVRRIIDLGVEVRLNTRVGTDISIDQIEKDFDAVFWGIGAQSGKTIPVPGNEAANCVSGVSFLRAYNEGRLQGLAGRVLVVGAGDTAMDVAAVARRIGNISHIANKDRPENVILGDIAHDVAMAAKRHGADVWIVYRRPISRAPATKHELESVVREGVEIHDGLAPKEVILGDDGRAKALRVVPAEWDDAGNVTEREGEEFDIECELIVGATGQAGDFTGIEEFANDWGLMDADKFYRSTVRENHFVGGDVIKPHLLTTAIGQASIAVDGIDRYLSGGDPVKRPVVDVHHFSLLEELRTHDIAPVKFAGGNTWGTDAADFAVHNFEDRSFQEIVSSDKLFLGHFEYEGLHRRREALIDSSDVLNNFRERFTGLSEEDVIKEADRCMSCGICFECDNCIIYCPQIAIFRVKKDDHAVGRYVYTDYDRCVGCHICMDVCPTGYIQMGMGE